jgi:osmoprotectant transport system substrate-binding protein
LGIHGYGLSEFPQKQVCQPAGREIYAAVKAKDAKINIVWLNASAANNTYALAVRQADAESKGIKTLEDLAAKLNAGEKLTLGCNIEFYKRDDGLKPLQESLWLRVSPL